MQTRIHAWAFVLAFWLASHDAFGADKPKVDFRTAEPEFTLDATDYVLEWKKDRKTAEQKYKGKIIEIKGIVESIHEDPNGNWEGQLFLEVKNERVGLQCAISDRNPWLKVKKGSKLVVRGTTAPIVVNSVLVRCVIMESDPFKPASVSVEELIKEFATDGKAAQKKYKGQWLIVEGDVSKTEKEKNRSVLQVFFKGDGDIKVMTRFDNSTEWLRERNKSIEEGKRLRIIGELDYDGDKKELVVSDAKVIK